MLEVYTTVYVQSSAAQHLILVNDAESLGFCWKRKAPLAGRVAILRGCLYQPNVEGDADKSVSGS